VYDGVDKPRPKTLFEVGEVVRVSEGPFVISMVLLKKLITIRAESRWRCLFLGALRQLSWSLVSRIRPDFVERVALGLYPFGVERWLRKSPSYISSYKLSRSSEPQFHQLVQALGSTWL